MNLSPGQILAIGAVGLAGAVLYFGARGVSKAAKAAGKAAKAAGEAFNPTDPDNLAYRGVNAVGKALTGDEHFTLGGYLYDLTHPPHDPVKAVTRYDGGALRGPLQ